MQNLRRISKILIWPGLVVAWLGAVAVLAQTSSPDVGLVTKLTGRAIYWNNEEKKPVPVQAFMKVRQGDQFKLARDSSITLLFFASGRQETWKGPATFMAGDAASAAADGKTGASPEVKMMPTSAIKMIAAAPFPLPRSGSSGATQMPDAPSRSGATVTRGISPSGRAGGTVMLEKTPPARQGAIQSMAPVRPVPSRGPSAEEARRGIQQAEEVYQDLKKKAGADDFTPELYFLGVLAKYRQYAEMNKILDKMLEKKPGDPALNELKNWVRTKSRQGG